MNPLIKLKERGQSVWLDFLSCEIIDNGHLERLIKEDGIAGITANPSTFEQAIGQSDYYDADIAHLVATGVTSAVAGGCRHDAAGSAAWPAGGAG